ncbi:hypothetical protein Tco_0619777 [Tanacetum coccineum]
MVAYLEKTDGNAEFHEIIDFLTRSSIHYALTVSPVVSTTFVEQFWMTAKSKTINNVRYITATVAASLCHISKHQLGSSTTGMKGAVQIVLLKPNPHLLLLTQVLAGIIKVTAQAANIKDLKAQIKQLKKKARPVINHHKAWIKSLSMKKRLARKKKMESVSHRMETIKLCTNCDKDPAFNDLDDAMDYMETEDAHDEGTVKDSEETRVSTEDQVSTDKLKVSTDKPNEGTAEPNEGTAEPKDGNSDESAAPTTVFRDDEKLLLQFFGPLLRLISKTKRRSSLGKAESDAESEGVNEAEKKFKMLANDEEIAKKVKSMGKPSMRERRSWLRKKLLKLHSPMSMTLFKQDLMQTRFLLRSFKKKREKSSPLSKELSFFMIPLLDKEISCSKRSEASSETALQEIREYRKDQKETYDERSNRWVLSSSRNQNFNDYGHLGRDIDDFYSRVLELDGSQELAIPEQTATGKGISKSYVADKEGKLKENQGCRVDTDQVHQNGDLKGMKIQKRVFGLYFSAQKVIKQTYERIQRNLSTEMHGEVNPQEESIRCSESLSKNGICIPIVWEQTEIEDFKFGCPFNDRRL